MPFIPSPFFIENNKMAKIFLSCFKIKILGHLLGSPTREGCNWFSLQNAQLLSVLSLQDHLQVVEA